MACLIKVPDTAGKGCVSFTTAERDRIINPDAAASGAVRALKSRFLVGLHHNWHDHAFSYDPLFDFSMAGDGDLIERDGKAVPCVPLDACNFAPACFAPKPGVEPFWDVLTASRAVFFKGIPEFFRAIRAIYDRGRLIRVLHLCPVPPAASDGTDLHDIRQRFEASFSPRERRFFTLMTMEWDYPFPLDLDTLAFFYRASRVYVHPSPEERRCRAAAYAWAAEMPVVARANVASILPSGLRRRPFWFEIDNDTPLEDAILGAIDAPANDPQWDAVASEFGAPSSARRLDRLLDGLAGKRRETMSRHPINPLGLDIRLGRHHDLGLGPNTVHQALVAFCDQLLRLSDAGLAKVAAASDPEITLALERNVALDIKERGNGPIGWFKSMITPHL